MDEDPPKLPYADGELLIDRTALSLLLEITDDPGGHAAAAIDGDATQAFDYGGGTQAFDYADARSRFVFDGVFEEVMGVPNPARAPISYDGRVLTMPGDLPATAMAALAGRPLADLAELPSAFDGRVIETVIRHPTGVGSWLMVTLTPDAVPLPSRLPNSIP